LEESKPASTPALTIRQTTNTKATTYFFPISSISFAAAVGAVYVDFAPSLPLLLQQPLVFIESQRYFLPKYIHGCPNFNWVIILNY